MSYPCCGLKRANSELDCDFAANAMVFLLRNCCRWDVSVAYSKARLKPKSCSLAIP